MNERDLDLIRRYREGDDLAFDEIYKGHAKRVYAFLRSEGHDAALADELTQRTFIKASSYLRRPSLATHYASLGALLTMEAKSEAADEERRTKRETRYREAYAAEMGSQTAPPADTDYNGREMRGMVLSAAGGMRPTMADVVVLFFVREYTAEEVAAITHAKVSAVHQRIKRARAKLAESFRPNRKGPKP